MKKTSSILDRILEKQAVCLKKNHEPKVVIISSSADMSAIKEMISDNQGLSFKGDVDVILGMRIVRSEDEIIKL